MAGASADEHLRREREIDCRYPEATGTTPPLLPILTLTGCYLCVTLSERTLALTLALTLTLTLTRKLT